MLAFWTPYAFQTLVTLFRGYPQNSLFGSRYGRINLDVYIPLFYSLIPLQTGFSAINNLQLGLSDLAAAAPPGEGLFGKEERLIAWASAPGRCLPGILSALIWPGRVILTGNPFGICPCVCRS